MLKYLKFLFFLALMLVANSMVASNPVIVEEESSSEAAREELMIYLSNLYETNGHKEAVAQVLQAYYPDAELAPLPSGNYTYEWTANPGGANTTCNLWPSSGRRVDVSVNYDVNSSSRVELQCNVYLNGALYDTLLYYWYLN